MSPPDFSIDDKFYDIINKALKNIIYYIMMFFICFSMSYISCWLFSNYPINKVKIGNTVKNKNTDKLTNVLNVLVENTGDKNN